MSSPTNGDAIQSALARPGYVPDGVTYDFLAENRDRPAIIAILFVGALVYVIMALRLYARAFVVKAVGWDDWLALLTLLPFTAFIALCVVLIHLGSGRHFEYIEYVLENSVINKTEVLDFAAHIIYTTALVICRLSGLAFYARISNRHRGLTWSIRIAAVFIVLAYLPQLFLIIFHCIPVTGLWPYAFQPELNDFTCIQWGTVYVTNSVISLLCDLILFTIPTLLISKLKISTPQKIGLSFVLMPGLLVIGISSARMYLVIVGQWNADESWSYDPLLAVEVSEIGSTLIALSVPALKPFFGNIFDFLDRKFISKHSQRFRLVSGTENGRRNSARMLELQERYGGAVPAYAKDLEPGVGKTTARQGSGKDGLDLAAALESHGNLSTDTTARATPEDGYRPSFGSKVSQKPMIDLEREYAVDREGRKTDMDRR